MIRAHVILQSLRDCLDADENVKDEAGCFKVLRVLEKQKFTKEDLEETRLGGLVNRVRKKTANKQLSKQCKDLVRIWQKLLEDTTINNNNGAGISYQSISPANSSSNSSPAISAAAAGWSGAGKRPATKKATVAPASLSNKLLKRGNYAPSPTSETLSKKNVANKKRRRNDDGDDGEKVIPRKKSVPPNLYNTNNNVSPPLNCVVNHTGTKLKIVFGGGSGSTVNATQINGHVSQIPQRANKSSKQKNSKNVPAEALERLPLLPPSTSSSGARTDKVKTMAEIVTEMQAKGAVPLNCETAAAICNREILDVSKLEDASGPNYAILTKRPYRRKNMQDSYNIPAKKSASHDMTKTKNELVERYLATSQPPQVSPQVQSPLAPPSSSSGIPSPHSPSLSPPVPATTPESAICSGQPVVVLDRLPDSFSTSSVTSQHAIQELVSRPESSLSSASTEPQVLVDVEEESEKEPDEPNKDTLEALRRSLPPLNIDEITWGGDTTGPESLPEVCEENLRRLHEEKWEGVNGVYDSELRWRSWTECYPAPAVDADDAIDDITVMLPYVDIE